jgi:inner membrane transporter RhtA
MVTVQFGAALAKSLFPVVGPGGMVFLRIGFAALILLLLWRPRVQKYTRHQFVAAGLFGFVLAAMNLSFYASIERLPLGIAVAVEFSGPLAVAIVGSRHAADLLWAALAAAGILLVAPWSGSHLDPLGIALALVAGGFWAAYILLTAHTGQVFQGATGLALAMTIAALLAAPVGVLSAGSKLLDPSILLAGGGVAILSSVIPYSLELEALRHVSARVFGILMSMEPAIAALVGFLVVRETLDTHGLIAIACVTVASAGATITQRANDRATP